MCDRDTPTALLLVVWNAGEALGDRTFLEAWKPLKACQEADTDQRGSEEVRLQPSGWARLPPWVRESRARVSINEG